MLTTDVENGLPAADSSDETVHAFCRRFLPDFYFVNTPISRMRRHLELMRQLPTQPALLDFHRPLAAHFTELTLCVYDDSQPGLLSKVAGTLASLKINVHTAWIHTLSNPNDPRSGRRVVLDTLILSEPALARTRTRPLSAKTQEKITRVLQQVLQGQLSVIELMATRRRRALRPLEIYDVSASLTGDGYTLLKLRAADRNGVLYRVTSALAALQLNVAHAQVNTFEKSVDDVFFVLNSRGMALSERETERIISGLRAMLQEENGI